MINSVFIHIKHTTETLIETLVKMKMLDRIANKTP